MVDLSEGLHPRDFKRLTGYKHSQIAEVLGVSEELVKRWFVRGSTSREPSQAVMMALAYHYEKVRDSLPPRKDQIKEARRAKRQEERESRINTVVETVLRHGTFKEASKELGITKERCRQIFRVKHPDFDLGAYYKDLKRKQRTDIILDAVKDGEVSIAGISRRTGIYYPLVSELVESNQIELKKPTGKGVIGNKYGAWEVIADEFFYKHPDGVFRQTTTGSNQLSSSHLLCRCSCGIEKYVAHGNLKRGLSKGCISCTRGRPKPRKNK